MSLLRIFIAFFCCFYLSVVFANSLHIKRYSIEQGLSQEAIRTIYQDHLGYLWLGTEEGLNRFDGLNFVQYRHQPSQPNTLSSDLVYAITGAINGDLWIGTKGANGGLNKYAYSDDNFIRYQNSSKLSSLSSNNISSLFIDRQNRLWVGTEKHGVNLLISELGDGSFKRIDITSGLSSNAIRAIAEDSLGRIWVGTDDAGISIIDPVSWQVEQLRHDQNDLNSLSDDAIRSLSQADNGDMFVGTAGGGLNRYVSSSAEFIHYRHDVNDESSISSNRVLSIFKDNRNQTWVGTEQGLNLFHQERFKRYYHSSSNLHSLSHNRVLSIFQDSGGIMWFGTFAGLDKWNPDRARFNPVMYQPDQVEKSVSHNVITHFYEHPNGDIFISTYGGGLLIYDPQSGLFDNITTAQGISDNRVMTSLVAKDGSVWLGTRGSGVDYRPANTNSWRNISSQSSSLPANGITDIFQDQNDNIWLTSYKGGLSLWLAEQQDFKNFYFEVDNKAINRIYQVHQDNVERLFWLVTDSGLIRFNPDNGNYRVIQHNPNQPKSMSANHLLYLYEDSNSNFWLASLGGGVNLLSKQARLSQKFEFSHFQVANGLVSNSIYGITEDASGHLWFSSNRGLTKFNPQSGKFKHYNKSHGLQGNDFNHNAVLRTRSGQLFFGGSNGFNYFDPLSIKDNHHTPQVHLTNVLSLNEQKFANKSLHDLQSVDFDYQDYLVTFEFIGLDFSAPEKNQYKYKLKGFDPDWVEATNHPRATYTNLPPGDYVFSVKAANNDGVWGEEAINLKVSVHPAFWQSWWAYSVYILLISSAIYIWLRAQAKKLAKEELYNHKLSQEVSNNKKNLQQLNQQLEQSQLKVRQLQLVDSETAFKTSSFLQHYLPISIAKIDAQFNELSALELANKSIRRQFVIIIKLHDEPGYLAHLIDVLKRFDREIDLNVRLHSNEFILIGEKQDPAAVNQLAQQITLELQSKQLTSKSDGAFNIGFACYPFEADKPKALSWEQVMLIANQAVNSAKLHADRPCLGVLGCRCEPSELFIAELMHANDITSLSELLILSN